MKGIIVDTSSIIFALANKVDPFTEIENQLGLKPVISRGIVDELKRIGDSRRSNGKYARMALNLIEKHSVSTELAGGYADRWILSTAAEFDAVCTNDTKLRRELRGIGIVVYAVSRDGKLRG